MSLPVVLYVGLWANPPYDRLSDRFAHMQDDCKQVGCQLRVWHWDHPGHAVHDSTTPVGVILSGSRFDLPCASDAQRAHRPVHDYAPLLAQLAEWQVPVLGICYGHQLLALHQGCSLGLLPEKRRCGDHAISVIADDPVLGCAGSSLLVPENHQMLVQEVDQERWRIVAQSSDGIEALRHRSHPWLGVQFHPEYHPESNHNHAQEVLQRWLMSVLPQSAAAYL